MPLSRDCATKHNRKHRNSDTRAGNHRQAESRPSPQLWAFADENVQPTSTQSIRFFANSSSHPHCLNRRAHQNHILH